MSAACALCRDPAPAAELKEAAWLAPQVVARVVADRPDWQPAHGACRACVQQALLTTLLEHGEAALHAAIQRAWPLDPEAAFGVLPTPLRLHADPRFTGRGVTLALVDAAFHPHPDLVLPRNRVRAWADVGTEVLVERRFTPEELPRWPGWDAGAAEQWHGLMTSTVAAGHGGLAHGLYRGLASDVEVVLVQVRQPDGHITNAGIVRALSWLRRHAAEFGVRVVNLSLGGELVEPLARNPVDEAVAALVEDGLVVVVAAGNDGERRLVPPGTAPSALTIGGLDDRNVFDDEERQLWHSNYGTTSELLPKPELVAPSLRVVAPLLPGSALAVEAATLFARRATGEPDVEARLAELRLVTPHYQHVEGTSFAAPIVASAVACMLEANPALTPRRVRELLVQACHSVPGAAPERQGAGALDAGRALALALADHHSGAADYAASPRASAQGLEFLLHDHAAREVALIASWLDWRQPGLAATAIEPGLWRVQAATPPPGVHAYKYLLDGERWLVDPANPARVHDGQGGWNSRLVVP